MVDVSATTLDIAGVKVPANMHGMSFLNKNQIRDYVYGFRGRAGDADDDIRGITDGKFKLILNRMPELPYMQLSSYKKSSYPGYTYYFYLDSIGKLPAPYNQFLDKERTEIELYNLENDPCEFNNLAGDENYNTIKNQLFDTLSTNLRKFEVNFIRESQETIAKVKKSSFEYGQKLLEDKGISMNSSLEAWKDYWMKLYGLEED